MAITKNILTKQIKRIETLNGAYNIFEDDKRTSNAILEKTIDEVDLLIAGAIDWIKRYRSNKNAIQMLNNLESELNNLDEVNIVVLNIAVRTIDFINYYIFDKN